MKLLYELLDKIRPSQTEIWA